LTLAKAMFAAAVSAWDERQVSAASSVRTINIPTFDVLTTDFRLSRANGARLYESGVTSTTSFFAREATQRYLEQFDSA
jgi:hypothetical protein